MVRSARGRDVIGRPVIHQPSGRRLGQVAELLLDENGQRVVGLVLPRGGWFTRPVAVPFQLITGIGPDVILVDDLPAAGPDALPPGTRTWTEVRNSSSKRLYSRSGQEMGMLDDVVFDEATGQVMGYRLSGGFIADLVDGRPTLAATSLSIGEDGVFVDGVNGLDLGPLIEG